MFRGGSRTAATSKLELFAIIVNDFQPLSIITESSTLDVAAVLDPPLIFLEKFMYHNIMPKLLKLEKPIKCKKACNTIKEYQKKLLLRTTQWKECIQQL